MNASVHIWRGFFIQWWLFIVLDTCIKIGLGCTRTILRYPVDSQGNCCSSNAFEAVFQGCGGGKTF